MKNKFPTIEEQSDRIKSLFTDERLYGNLVNEQTEEDCIELLKDKYYVVPKSSDEGKAYSKNVEGCIKNPDNTYTLLGKVYKIISENTDITSKVKITLKNNCQIHLNGSSNCSAYQNHIITGSIFQTDDDFKLRIQLAVKFASDDVINNNFTGTYANYGKVGYVSMDGDINAININFTDDDTSNDNAKITNLEFAGIHGAGGTILPGSNTLKTTSLHKWEDASGGKPTWEEIGEEFIYVSSPKVDLSTVLEGITWCQLSRSSTYKIKAS